MNHKTKSIQTNIWFEEHSNTDAYIIAEHFFPPIINKETKS